MLAFEDSAVRALRSDLSLALRAADHHGLSEGVCNHFSMALPDSSDRFLLNPRGLHWSEIGEDDIVMVDGDGNKLAGRHEVEPTAMHIHAAVHRVANKTCVMHTHMPYATAIGCIKGVPFDSTLSQNAMLFHGRIAVDHSYNGLALDAAEGERIARSMNGADIVFLANHGVIVCGERIDYAFADLYYLERACQVQMIAAASGGQLAPVSSNLAGHVAAQGVQERVQASLFFESPPAAAEIASVPEFTLQTGSLAVLRAPCCVRMPTALWVDVDENRELVAYPIEIRHLTTHLRP